MSEQRVQTAIGVISGTSMDGIDVALIRSDGEARVEAGPAATFPYPEPLARALRAVVASPSEAEKPQVELERAVTDAHVAAVEAFLQKFAVAREDVALAGLHGQTILHRPRAGLTRQLCDGARAAAALKIDVVCDFRSADVAAGGEGAPLAPVYHAAITAGLERPLMVLNWGGVGNVTWLGRQGEILAFDTGPANALIDDFLMRRRGVAFDADGALAASGRVDASALECDDARSLFRSAAAEVARPQPFRRARGRGRRLERRRRRGDARRLHGRGDSRRTAPDSGGAVTLAGRRRRTAQSVPDAPARRAARRHRSSRSRRSASTATRSKPNASPISPCVRAVARRCPFRRRPAFRKPMTGGAFWPAPR